MLKMLLAAELVETQRGVRGGYRLMKSLSHISLVDIVEAMEGPIAVTDCVESAREPCSVSNCCSVTTGFMNRPFAKRLRMSRWKM